MTHAALKLALEALEDRSSLMRWQTARYVVKAALAQPAQQPLCTAAMFDEAFLAKSGLPPDMPLYTTPPQPAQQEPVAWQVEMFIAGEWVPLGNPQRSKTKAEALASNPSLSKEHQRIFPVYTAPQPTQEPVAWMDIDEKGSASGLRYWSEPDNRHEVALYTKENT